MTDDVISREKAIKAACQGFCHPGAFCPDTGCKQLDPIKSIPAENQWVPCSERPPETPDPVLVTLKWAEDDYEVSIDEYWSGVPEHQGWGYDDEKVVAWRPLPKPFRGESKQ